MGEDRGEGKGSIPEPEFEGVKDTDGAPLLPECRPPLRPGGMPKLVSKAALNVAVDTAEEELGMITIVLGLQGWWSRKTFISSDPRTP